MTKKIFALVVFALNCCIPIFAMEQQGDQGHEQDYQQLHYKVDEIVCTKEEWNYLKLLYQSRGVDDYYATPALTTMVRVVRIVRAKDVDFPITKIPAQAAAQNCCQGDFYCPEPRCTFTVPAKHTGIIEAHYKWHAKLVGFNCEECQATYDTKLGLAWHNLNCHKNS